MNFFVLEVIIGGLLTGVLYSLVALGFVLIFKASGVFNFAQGAMCLFAALALVRLMEAMPAALALIAAALIMLALAVAIERLVLRPLVNQDGLILFMATIGITFFITGLGQALFGSDVYTLDLGIPKTPLILFEPLVPGGILVNEFDLWAAVMAGVLVAVLAVFFQRTRIGRALRAVADDHQAAQSVGIPLQHIWAIVWGVAGAVALVAGLMWGVRNGVQFALTFVALKALPVLLIGGFESIPGAIIGGLIIGATEKLAEVYVGPMFGGGIESWFAYVVALLFLLVRPEGLFGEKHIDRV